MNPDAGAPDAADSPRARRSRRAGRRDGTDLGPTAAAHPLVGDFARRLRGRRAELGPVQPDAHLLVAVSGGLDSVVLLHLLRFHGGGRRLTAAHFDHNMRPGSGDDAAWVRGLCAAWRV